MISTLVDEQLLKMLENEAKATSIFVSRLKRVHGMTENKIEAQSMGGADGSALLRVRRLREQLHQAQASAAGILSKIQLP